MALLVILPGASLFLDRPATPAQRAAGRTQRRRQRERSAAARSPALEHVPFVVALLLYTMLRVVTLGSVFGPTSPIADNIISKLLAAVGLYTGKLVLPVRQSAYISDLPTDPIVLLTTVAVVIGAGLAARVAWRRSARSVTFLLLWMALTLVPSLAIVVKIPAAPVAERYLYLPSVGFCLLCGYAAARWLAAVCGVARRAGMVAVGVGLAVSALATVQRNAVWRSNLSLWQDTANKNTTDGLPMRSLAAAYLAGGDSARAAEYFQLALERRNDQRGQFVIHNNLGSLAMRDKKLDAAEGHYRTALAIDPHAPDCLYNLGLIALTRATDTESTHDPAGKHDQAQRARQLFEQAQQLSPLDPDIHLGLGQALRILGDPSAARAQYERALELGLPPATEASVRKLLEELG